MDNFTITLASGSYVFDQSTLVFTSTDGSTTTTFSIAASPVVTETDTGITVTHADGTTANFVPELVLPETTA